ncbi:hypothetical protein BpHYR1_043019, partial [Brachionus plicatilis]
AKLQSIGTILDSYISKKENVKETLDEKINLEELIKENLNDILEGKITLQELLGLNIQEQDKNFRNELKQHWETLTSLWEEFSKMGWLLISYVSEPLTLMPIRDQVFSTRWPHPIQTRFPQPFPTHLPILECLKKRHVQVSTNIGLHEC